MAGNMYDYLSVGTADYTATELDIKSQGDLTETMHWNQDVHQLDGSGRKVITHGDEVLYEVQFSFEVLTNSEVNTIIDMHNNPAKAKGSEKTFYWHHPTDEYIYVARFHPSMEKLISYFKLVRQLNLWIEAYKQPVI